MTGFVPSSRRFCNGDRVKVIHLGKPGHVRIPFYVRGKIGEVVHYCGSYLNPESLAVGRTDGPAVDLYRVKFAQRELWSDDKLPTHDWLVIEVYDHWLMPEERHEVFSEGHN